MKTARKYTSYLEYVDRAKLPATPEYGIVSRDLKEEFHGTKTFEDAIALAERGWPEGLRLVGKLGAQLTTTLGSLREEQTTTRDTTGAWVDIGAFCSGDPEHMLDFAPRMAPGPGNIIKLVVALSASHTIDAEVIHRRGAAIMALVDALEDCGRGVEIILNHSVTQDRANRYESEITLKGPGVALSPEQIAFAISHAASLRRITFAVCESEPSNIRGPMGFHRENGYGTPDDATDTGDIYIPCLRGNAGNSVFTSDAAALRWIREELKKQGAGGEK